MVRRTSSRRRLLVAALGVSLVAAMSSPAAQADDLKHKKRKVQSQIHAARGDLEDSSQAAVAARASLTRAKSQLVSARANLHQTRVALKAARKADRKAQAALTDAQQRLADAQAQVDAARVLAGEQRKLVGRLAAERVQGINPALIGLVTLANSQDLAQLSLGVQTANNVQDRQNKQLASYRESLAALSRNEKQVKAATDEVAQRRKAAAANLDKRENLEQQATAAEERVTVLVRTRTKARARAEAAKAADLRELKKLKAENARIERLLARRAGQAGDLGNSGPLLRPVTGYVTSNFGWRIHPIYHYWGLHDGTDFHAPCGTPLRAAGNGKVISEYFQTAWGNRLILDLGRVNGHGVSVIYNHLSAYSVRTGDTVKRGDTVGLAGTTGWSTACHLHFTVMVDGKPQNPMNWF